MWLNGSKTLQRAEHLVEKLNLEDVPDVKLPLQCSGLHAECIVSSGNESSWAAVWLSQWNGDLCILRRSDSWVVVIRRITCDESFPSLFSALFQYVSFESREYEDMKTILTSSYIDTSSAGCFTYSKPRLVHSELLEKEVRLRRFCFSSVWFVKSVLT